MGATTSAPIAASSSLEQTYEQTKAAYEADKSDSNKDAYVDATVALGTEVMTDGSLPSRVKYPRALELYKEALALDPKNEEALANMAMIENIYRDLGRPIPQ